MTVDQFRRLALAIPGAVESSHMGHPDFRLQGRIFATLGYPDDGFGMAKLSSTHQRSFIEKSPSVFAPCAGAWGKNGATSVFLRQAKTSEVQSALKAASTHLASKKKNYGSICAK